MSIVCSCLASIVVPAHAASTKASDGLTAEATAGAHEDAASYITALVEQTVPEVATTPAPQRSYALRRLLDEHADLPGMAQFAMGRYWRLANDGERIEFVRLFQELVVQTSDAGLADYNVRKFRIARTRDAGDNEIVVRSELSLNDGPAVQIDWTLQRTEERFRISDVVVEGISIRIAMRDLFAAAIQEKGGTIAALLASMRDLVRSPMRDAR